MSEASFRFRPRPASPGRARGRPSDGADRLGPATRSPFDDEPVYPLDPPLVDVRMPVNPPHATATAYSRMALMHRYPDAEVGDDLHMFFSEPGKVKRSLLSPDVFVALKVPRGTTRDDYDADLLGPPDFVLEVLSASTWKHDVGRKLDCYQQIGVRECLLFDVRGEDRAGTGKELWGFALTPERRQPMEEVTLPNGERGVRSAVLGLVAYVAERKPPRTPKETWELTMRWHDPATATDLRDYDQVCDHEEQAWAQAQAERAAREEAQRVAREERARREAEQRQREEAQHVAEAERSRREEAQREAREERARREEAQRVAEAERSRSEAAERRVAELEARLRRDER